MAPQGTPGVGARVPPALHHQRAVDDDVLDAATLVTRVVKGAHRADLTQVEDDDVGTHAVALDALVQSLATATSMAVL